MTSVTTDRRFGVNASLAYKVPVVAATTANITLEGEQTIDGVSVVDGDRVLVKNQTTASENGIYEADSSTWNRTPDFDGSYDIVSGTRVFVTSGTQSGIWYISSSNPITINNSNINFTFSDVSLPSQSGNDGYFLKTDGTNPSWAAITESDISDLGTTIVLDTDIGVTVQGYDAGLAYLDGLNFTNEATFKAAVNLEIGTDVQAYDADLSTIAALTSTTDGLFIVGSATGWVGESGATARASLDVYSTGEVDALITAEDLDVAGDTGTGAIDLDSETFTIAGGTGLDTVMATNTLTVSIDSTVATLTGSQTLTNKTIDTANNTITIVEADISDLQAYLVNVVEDTTPQLGGALDGQGNDLNSIGVIFMTEQAAAEVDVVGDGQWWVKSDTPNIPMFTNDAGTDFEIITDTDTQTLTNKTIDTANNTITVVEADISDLQAYLVNVVEDTTPTLGGNLDAGGFDITNIDDIHVGGNSLDAWRSADGVIKVGYSTALYSGTAAANPYGVMLVNAYINTGGTTVYRESNYSSGIQVNAGRVLLLAANTGTAGGAVTYTSVLNAAYNGMTAGVALDMNSNAITNATINTASNTITVVEADISDLQAYLLDITGEPLSDLSDVTITAIASGELLKWNGSAWINNTLAEAGVAAASHTHVEADITDLQSYLLPADIGVTVQGYDADTAKLDVAQSWTALQKFPDTLFNIVDNTDATKIIAFEASGITTATTRTITMADQNIDLTPASGTYAAASHTHVEADITDLQSYLVNVSEDTTPTLGGALDAGGFDINNGGVIFLTEQAAAEVDVAGKGQIWVKTATPNELMFTDDAGTDWTVAFTSDISGFLSNVVEDTTPQLGGSLDAQSNTITGAGNITVTNGNGPAIQNETSGNTNPVLCPDQSAVTSGLGGAANAPAVVVSGSAVAIFDATDVTLTKPIKILEAAAAVADDSAYGQFWVESLTPNIPKYTDDAGTDYSIVLDTKAQTLTNKTINTASNTITVVEADISDLGTYLENVSEDTTPQLGGNLDVNGNKITSASSGNIDIEPNGTGNVLIGNFTFDADQSVGVGQDNYVLTYDNATGLISLEASAGGGLTDVVDDTTPQLGGDLDTQGNLITGGGINQLQSPTTTTSGTSHDYTSIPDWVTEITCTFHGVSSSSTSMMIVQLGDSGGIETTGYTGRTQIVNGTGATNWSSGFAFASSIEAATLYYGKITLSLVDATNNVWASSVMIYRSTNALFVGTGTKALSATLTQLRLTTAGGSDTFDAGTFNISYH